MNEVLPVVQSDGHCGGRAVLLCVAVLFCIVRRMLLSERR